MPPGNPGPDDPPATTLLNDLPGLETRLLAALVNPDAAEKLKPIAWDEVSTRVYLPQWTTLVQANASTLSGLTPEMLPQTAANLKSFGLRLRTPDDQTPDTDNAEGLACAVVGAALALLIVQRGGTAHSPPGQPVSVTIGSAALEPFGLLPSLADGKLTADEWQRQCNDLDIRGVDLGKVVPLPETTP